MKPSTPSLALNGPFAPTPPPYPLSHPAVARSFDKTTVLYPPGKTPMRRLSPAERASLLIVWDPDDPFVNEDTIPIQAALRLRIYTWRAGTASILSGSYLMRELQEVFWSRGRGIKYPWRGYDLLRAIDATSEEHGVRVYIDAQRLTARLRELGWSE